MAGQALVGFCINSLSRVTVAYALSKCHAPPQQRHCIPKPQQACTRKACKASTCCNSHSHCPSKVILSVLPAAQKEYVPCLPMHMRDMQILKAILFCARNNTQSMAVAKPACRAEIEARMCGCAGLGIQEICIFQPAWLVLWVCAIQQSKLSLSVLPLQMGSHFNSCQLVHTCKETCNSLA